MSTTATEVNPPEGDAANVQHIIRRFEADEAWRRAIEDRLDRGSDRMKAIEDELRQNTDTTREVRELMELGRSGFKVLGFFGVAAKWVGAIAAAFVSVWGLIYTITHGGKPPGN